MKQSPIHLAVLTLYNVHINSRRRRQNVEVRVPFLDFGKYFKCFFYTFIGNIRTFVKLCLVGVAIETKDIVGIFCADCYKRSGPRPEDLFRTP